MAWVVEETQGDGNCAFNAFVRALVRELEKLRAYYIKHSVHPNELSEFTHRAAHALNVANDLNAVITEIIKLSQYPVKLQATLGPVMRELSIFLIQKNPDQHRDATLVALIAAFHHSRGDDIFLSHPHIRAKFAELKDDTEVEAKLSAWWLETGHAEFLRNMADKKARYWAGDLELVPLANYFRTILYIKFSHSDKLYSPNSENDYFGAQDSTGPVNIVLTNCALHWSSVRWEEKSFENFQSNPAAFFPSQRKLKNNWKEMERLLTPLAQLETGKSSVYSLEGFLRRGNNTKPTASDITCYHSSSFVNYKMGNREIHVDKLTQELLDHELAKKLQLEENKLKRKYK